MRQSPPLLRLSLTGFCSMICLAVLFVSCESKKPAASIACTWELLTGTIIERNDTTVTDYTKGKKFIKIINDSHFSFISHDLNKGKDSTAFYVSGGGTYTFKDSAYTENLEFCSDRTWENNSFHFTVTIHNDTLIQQGVEKVAGTPIDRLNIEKYIRVK